MMMQTKIHPVILSGGSGSRLWPLSRALHPKQLLPLLTNHTMVQDTALRLTDARFHPPLFICNEAHRFIIAEQMRELGIAPQRLILEPLARNTAPACAAAALFLLQTDPQALMAILPSDHGITRPDAFLDAITIAVRAALAGNLVTFGMKPTAPETGYGYILAGEPQGAGAFKVARFIEKPDSERAAAMLAEPGYHWNSGMFVFKAADFIDELKRLSPEIYEGVARAVANAKSDADFLRLDRDAFASVPANSVDYAVMEHTQRAVVVPADFGWSDVGSWSALWEISDKDQAGNRHVGDVLSLDCKNSYLRGEGLLVAGIGLENMVVVATDDSVLVADRAKVQDVRKIVDQLKALNRSEGDLHRRVYRPWGFYQSVNSGSRFQVKQIMLRPGAQLSLQMHHHRAEHWIVVEGTARITCDDKVFILQENQSTFIPLGSKHRLENPGLIPLRLIEVQSGGYLGEDDIVRFEDHYGRA